MSYVEEFKFLLEEEKIAQFLRLWEEYCMMDHVEGKELAQILQLIKDSTAATTFGPFAETALPLWNKIKDTSADAVLRLVLDLQTVNSTLLADLATDYLKKRYGDQSDHHQKMRLIGLLGRTSFQGAIARYELISHMQRAKFVFHTGGWGAGEVIEISLLREHVVVEFEGITANKDLSFDNAFKHLIPLAPDHFLARRFGNPDALEKEAKEDPIKVIYLLLRDLGPKSAQEIKEELCTLVIPEEEWAKWWQQARTKIKKDTKIHSPESTKEPFVLQEQETSHTTRLKEALKKERGVDGVIQTIYNHIRDFPEILKDATIKQELKGHLLEGLREDALFPLHSLARKIQASFLLEDIFPEEFPSAAEHLIAHMDNLVSVLNHVDIVAFKKRVLTVIRSSKKEWTPLFLHLLFSVTHHPLRDYIFKELQQDRQAAPLLKDKIYDLLHKVTLFPETFFWYFQKICADEQVPYNDSENRPLFLEAYFILLHFAEMKEELRDLGKKMYQLLIAKRYAVIRALFEKSSIAQLQELLLLASKCQSFTKHDMRILQNLAEVAQPQMSQKKEKIEEEVIWTTTESYRKMQERIQHIGTVETIENAKEIEAARALGDLRENAEYKFALEKRARLQAELHQLTQQLNQARILTKEDISAEEISVGSIVELLDSKGVKLFYTILGPWDADPDKCILSSQSKLAQAMIGHKEGDSFGFQGEHYKVAKVKGYL